MTKPHIIPSTSVLKNHFNTNIGVWKLDCTSSQITFNSIARAIIGATDISQKHLSINAFFHILKPENSTSLTQQFYDFIRKNDHFLSRDYCVIDNEGEQLWIRMHGTVSTRDAAHKPLEVRGTIVDVTQEKHEQEQLYAEAQRARDILDAVNIGTWEWSCTNKNLIIDKKAQEILGFTQPTSSKDVFTDWLKKIHEQDKPLFHKGLNDILSSQENSFLQDSLEYRFEKTPNNFIWIQIKGKKISHEVLGTLGARGTIVDVTHRKTSEINALRLKQHINNVIEATDMGSWEWHCRTDKWQFNSRFLSMLGWSEDQKITRKALKKTVHNDDFHKEYPLFRNFILGKTNTYQGDFRVLHQEGYWIWVRTFARRTGTQKGKKIEKIVGYNLDVTKQKLDEICLATNQLYSHQLNMCSKELLQDNEGALQKALKHLHKALDTSKVCLFQTGQDISGETCLELTNECLAPGLLSAKRNNDPCIIYPNKPPFQKWGEQLQTGQYICGCRENFSPEESDFLLYFNTQSTIMMPIFARGQWMGLVCFGEKDKKRIWTHDEIAFAQLCAEMIGSYTLRKIVEQDLVKSEERLRSMMENGSRGIWETDIKGNLNYFTDTKFCLGTKSASKPSIATIFQFLSPEDAEKSLTTLAECIKEKKNFPSQRNWITKSNGTRACYTTSGIPLLNDNDELIGFRGTYNDITQEVKREMQLQESQKMQALGKLAGGVAHDFNNQLTGIMGYAALLLEDISKEDQATFVQNILTCAKRSADLTQQLLTFSKHSQIRSNHIDLTQIIDEVYSILSYSLDKKIRLEKYLPQTPLIIKGDSSLLQNALLNLALNAKDSVGTVGEVSIQACAIQLSSATCERMTFDIQAGEYAKITISDTGCGMDEETLQRIFEPFFSTKGKQGTGMGLATAHGTIIQHGGAIEVYSQVGKGTSFTIYLPLSTDVSVSLTPQEETHLPAYSQHIVLIDDEKHILEIGSIYLRDQGFRVTSIDNGKEAISYIQKNFKDIDLIVSDIIMPKVNGWQVFQATKQIIENPNFIFVSGYSDEVDNAQMREAGITAFIPKPFTRKNFLATIAKAFDHKDHLLQGSVQ